MILDFWLRFCWRGGSSRYFCFRLPLDVAGGVPFAEFGGVGLAMALALATSRLVHVLVTCHVFELGLITTGRAGGFPGGNRPFCAG
jgi:hypothetical protein